MTGLGIPVLALSGAQWIFLICFIIPVLIMWGYAIINLFSRHDLDIGPRLLWLLVILVLPLSASILYFMLRPAPQEQHRRAQARAKQHKH